MIFDCTWLNHQRAVAYFGIPLVRAELLRCMALTAAAMTKSVTQRPYLRAHLSDRVGAKTLLPWSNDHQKMRKIALIITVIVANLWYPDKTFIVSLIQFCIPIYGNKNKFYEASLYQALSSDPCWAHPWEGVPILTVEDWFIPHWAPETGTSCRGKTHGI